MTAATAERVLATNRAAFHNYHISAKFEAGVALTGTEVKSVLEGRIQLKDSYVGVREGEAWLFNAHVSPFTHGNRANPDPLRTRKLLLHKREIERLDQAAAAQGMTLVITRVYVKNQKIKFEIGVAKGKKLYDKRETELRRIVVKLLAFGHTDFKFEIGVAKGKKLYDKRETELRRIVDRET